MKKKILLIFILFSSFCFLEQSIAQSINNGSEGCEAGTGELEINISEEKRAKEYRKLDNTARNANYAVMDILKFNGKYLNMLECVILSPLTMGASGY